jgi:hypothetical protein
MTRILFSLALALSLTVGVVPNANADTVTFPCGGTATYSVLMPQGVLLDGKNCSGSLAIDKSVQTIGVKAFFGNYNISSVVIPDGVKLIDEQAFFSSSLSEITIPNSVTTINRSAFGFTRLTSLTLPNALTRISSQAFYGIKISSLIIPPSVTIIEYSAFGEVPLTSLVIPNTVTEIGMSAFQQSKLVSVTIPDSVRVLGASVFKDNTSLTSISLPDGLSQIGLPAFAGNYALTAIYFCGSFPSGTFPITQTCPPDRQVAIDAAKAIADKAAADKAAADKAAADKAAADLKVKQDAEATAASAALKILIDQVVSSKEELGQRIRNLIKKYPSERKFDALGQYLSKIGAVNESNYRSVEAVIYRVVGDVDALEERSLNTRTTITCTKGKLIKKVTAIKPKCPTGYKVKK